MFSIGFHEFGHFFWARKFGMRVPQFFVGFGPTVWSRHRGETEFGVKAVPLGGFIRIVGMIPPAEEGESRRATRMRSFIAEVRGQALNDVLPTDGNRVFYAKPWWQRVIVMFAGPFHNLVLAVLLFLVLLVGIGIPMTSTTIDRVPECVLPATSTSTTCPADASPSPAAAAGLRAGDRIVAVEGRAIAQDPNDKGWDTLVRTIQANAGQTLSLTVERDGAQRSVTVTPIENRVRNGDGDVVTAGYLGVTSATVYARQPVGALPGYFGTIIKQSVQRLAQIPERVPQLVRATFMGEERDPNGPIGLVGVGRLSGEAFSHDDFTVVEKISFFVSLLASINMVLFIFNLVPIYPLDGGHVAGAVYEKARSVVARWRGRPDPGPFDIARLMPVAYLVAGVFVVFSGLLVIADLINPITLD